MFYHAHLQNREFTSARLPRAGAFPVIYETIKEKYGPNIRFFHCGEYGERLSRPHYHACLLNFDFPDKRYLRTTPRGDDVYTSASLAELWPDGLHEIGSVSFESAAYVARYVTKKVTGDAASVHYARVDLATGELAYVKPEYTTMSRRPGIGAPWLERFHKDVYSRDRLVTRSGAQIAPPRFYDGRYELIDPEGFRRVMANREARDVNVFGSDAYKRQLLDNTPDRLKVRETVHSATVNTTLKRTYEE